MSDMADKRTQPRFGPLVIKALVDIEGSKTEGYLTNISAGGAFLAIDDPPAVGTQIGLRAVLPWKLGELRATATIVWRNDSVSKDEERLRIIGAGVSFNTLEDDAAEILDAYLERFKELAAQLD